MSPKLLNILLILIPVVAYYGVFDPLYNGNPGLVWTPAAALPVLQTRNVQYTDALNQVALIKQSSAKLGKDYDAIPGDIKNSVGILLPDSIDPIRLRNEVLAIADNAGIPISGLDVTVNSKSSSDKLGAYLVAFNIKGHYSEFKKFMEVYERNMRFFTLSGLTIRRPEKKAGEINDPQLNDKELLNFTITSVVYYFK